MDVYLTDLQDPGAQVTDLGEHAPDQGAQVANLGGHAVNPGGRAAGLDEHVLDLGARGEVSRARAVVSFLRAKILSGANAACQGGLRAAENWRKRAIERTVPSRAYVGSTMFDQTFISAGSRPGGAHGVGGVRRRAWVVSPARVIVLMGFRRDRIGV